MQFLAIKQLQALIILGGILHAIGTLCRMSGSGTSFKFRFVMFRHIIQYAFTRAGGIPYVYPSATNGPVLDKMAHRFGVYRNPGESDVHFRARLFGYLISW